MGPIKEQRSGLGGGRVPIIGGIGRGKLSSFVSNSSVLHGLVGFLWFSDKSCRVQGQHKFDFSGLFSQMHRKCAYIIDLQLTQLSAVIVENNESMYARGAATRPPEAHTVFSNKNCRHVPKVTIIWAQYKYNNFSVN